MSKYALSKDTSRMLSLYISEDDYRTLQKVRMLDRDQDALVARAVMEEYEVLIYGTYADFDTLAGMLAFEVNHSRGAKQMAINDVCEEVEMLLERARRR